MHPWQWVCVAPKLMLAMLALANGDGIRHGETLFFHCKMRCRSYSDCRTFCYSCVPEGTRTIHARLLVDCCTHHVELCGEQRSVMLLVCCLDMARSAHLGGQRRQASCGIMWIAKVCHVCCLDMARSAQLGGQRRSANFENG